MAELRIRKEDIPILCRTLYLSVDAITRYGRTKYMGMAEELVKQSVQCAWMSSSAGHSYIREFYTRYNRTNTYIKGCCGANSHCSAVSTDLDDKAMQWHMPPGYMC
jgi:hypothetical protein